MSKVVTVTMIGTVPIPVGHEVEVTYFKRIDRRVGLFGGDKVSVSQLGTPRIVDRTTGIVYDHFAHYGGGMTLQGGRINLEHRNPLPELHPRSQVLGKVRACHVTTIGFDGHGPTQVETLLELELLESG